MLPRTYSKGITMATATLVISEKDAPSVIGLLLQAGITFEISNREPTPAAAISAECPHSHEPQTVRVEGVAGLAELAQQLQASQRSLAAIIDDLRAFKAPQIEVNLTPEQINMLDNLAAVLRSLMSYGTYGSPLEILDRAAQSLGYTAGVAERGGFRL